MVIALGFVEYRYLASSGSLLTCHLFAALLIITAGLLEFLPCISVSREGVSIVLLHVADVVTVAGETFQVLP
jgi:hypothetical protein